jgi:hypothetical protein
MSRSMMLVNELLCFLDAFFNSGMNAILRCLGAAVAAPLAMQAALNAEHRDPVEDTIPHYLFDVN